MNEFVKKPGIPAYIQVEEYFVKKILNREVLAGEQLPTERDMAIELKVSRNTVSTAYQLLEKEGFAVSIQGKGTFVKKDIPVPVSSKKESILEAIDVLIDKALELNFTLDQLLSFVNLKIYEYNMKGSKLNLIVIDCNEEQVMFFAEYFLRSPFVSVHTVLLNELPKLKDSSLIKGADLIITTIKHFKDVKEMIKEKNILPVAPAPKIEALIQIANTVKTRKTGLVCSGKRFYEIFLNSLEKAGIPVNNIIRYDPESNLTEFVKAYDDLIVTPVYEKTVRNNLPMGDTKNIIIFYFQIDEGSINAINNKLNELRTKKHGE